MIDLFSGGGVILVGLIFAATTGWAKIKDAGTRRLLAERVDPKNPNMHLIAGTRHGARDK